MTRMMKKGLKDGNGNYSPAWYSHCMAYGKDTREVVVIYAKEYDGFSAEMKKDFDVLNSTDMMTDYFEKDRIVLEVSNPRFAEAKQRTIKN